MAPKTISDVVKQQQEKPYDMSYTVTCYSSADKLIELKAVDYDKIKTEIPCKSSQQYFHELNDKEEILLEDMLKLNIEKMFTQRNEGTNKDEINMNKEFSAVEVVQGALTREQIMIAGYELSKTGDYVPTVEPILSKYSAKKADATETISQETYSVLNTSVGFNATRTENKTFKQELVSLGEYITSICKKNGVGNPIKKGKLQKYEIQRFETVLKCLKREYNFSTNQICIKQDSLGYKKETVAQLESGISYYDAVYHTLNREKARASIDLLNMYRDSLEKIETDKVKLLLQSQLNRRMDIKNGHGKKKKEEADIKAEVDPEAEETKPDRQESLTDKIQGKIKEEDAKKAKESNGSDMPRKFRSIYETSIYYAVMDDLDPEISKLKIPENFDDNSDDLPPALFNVEE